MFKEMALIGLVGFFLSRCQETPDPIPESPLLQVVRVLPLENGPQRLEPSGLVFYKGMLFTVADKVDSVIYRIEFSDSAAHMVEHLRFVPPSRGRMDWEGITIDTDGNFYLASENFGRVAKVGADGTAEWISPDLRPKSREKGLFQKVNAGLEGITWLGDLHFLLAVEREPRGLVTYRYLREGLELIYPQWMNSTPFNADLSLLRIPDYSGLCYHDGDVYALFRNAHLVVRFGLVGDDYLEAEAWSYRHVETNPQWAYDEQAYGQAEGLAIQDGRVFIVFDNNRGGRQSDRRDTRSLFLEARFPEPTAVENF